MFVVLLAFSRVKCRINNVRARTKERYFWFVQLKTTSYGNNEIKYKNSRKQYFWLSLTCIFILTSVLLVIFFNISILISYHYFLPLFYIHWGVGFDDYELFSHNNTEFNLTANVYSRQIEMKYASHDF